MSSDPRVTFAFGTRGLARVKRDIEAVQAIAARGASAAGRGTSAAAPRSGEAERAASRAALIEMARRASLRRASREAAVRDEAAITAAAVGGSSRRGKASRDEATARGRAYADVARAGERAELAITRTAERESRRRRAAAQQERTAARGRVGQAVGNALQAVGGYASTMHGQIQGARRTRAETEHTLNSAFYQARVGGPEAAAMRAQVYREVESGRLQGLSADEVANSIAASQTQFSSLTAGTRGLSGADAAARRQQNLNDMLSAAEFARNTYQAPNEVMRVAGMLSAQGVTGNNQRSALMGLTGIAQAGSIELGDVVGQAMGPLMQNIANATARLGPNATADQRSGAVRAATLHTMAVGEVGAGAGLSPRDALNAMAKLDRNLQSNVVTSNLHDALAARRGGTAVANELFDTTRDARGRTSYRLKAGVDSLQAVSRLHQFTGGNITELQNLLQGGGGEAMVLDSQTRRLLGGLSSQTSGGESMRDHVQTLLAEGQQFGAADVSRGRDLVNAEQRTQIVSQEERRNAALTMDTAASRFSNAVDRFAANNPFASAGLTAGAGGAASLLAGGAGRLAGATSAGALGNAIAGGGAALGTTAGVLAAGAAGLGVGDLINTEIQRRTVGHNENGSAQDSNTFSLFNGGIAALVGELRTLPSTLSTVLGGASGQAAAQAAGEARAAEAARQRRT